MPEERKTIDYQFDINDLSLMIGRLSLEVLNYKSLNTRLLKEIEILNKEIVTLKEELKECVR